MKLVKKQKPSKYQFGFIQIDAETKLLIEEGFAWLKNIEDWESFKNMPEDLVVRPTLFQAFSQVPEHVVVPVVHTTIKAIREGKDLEFREVGSKDMWVIGEVEESTPVAAVTEYVRCFRSYSAHEVASVMRFLADQLEEIEGLE